MKLRDYLTREAIPMTAFGRRIGRSHTVVSRLCSGKSSPSMSLMATIERVTKGAVQARDFYPPSGHDGGPSGNFIGDVSSEHDHESVATLSSEGDQSRRSVSDVFRAQAVPSMVGAPESASERGDFHDIAPPTLKQAVFETGLREALDQPTHEGRLAALDQLETQVKRRVA